MAKIFPMWSLVFLVIYSQKSLALFTGNDSLVSRASIDAEDIFNKAARLVQNSFRVGHGGGELQYDATLHELAKTCANFHVTNPTDDCPNIVSGTTRIATELTLPIMPQVDGESSSRAVRRQLDLWYTTGMTATYPWTGQFPTDIDQIMTTVLIWKGVTHFACAASQVAGTGGYPLSCLYAPAIVEADFLLNVARDFE